MIAKVGRGSRAAGLMHYLLGPGKREEHVNPTVIGAWDGRPDRLAGLSAGEIGRMLEQPLGRLDASKRVWHTSLRNHADDRVLSNEEWVEVARDVLARAGISPVGDDGAARWVVVRHGEDHVHVAAVLARQDTGEPIWPANDYRQARLACTSAEERLGLRLTNRDGHGRPGRSRAEEERVGAGGEDLRGRLRRVVEAAAGGSAGSDEFLGRLRGQGVLVETRVDAGGMVTGFRVAVADVDPVWFGGSKLHRSLSWPQLQKRWEQPAGDGDGLSDAELLTGVERTVGVVGGLPVGELDGSDIPAAAGALLRAAVHVVDGRFETDSSRAVDEFLRAVPEDRGMVVRPTLAGGDLRGFGLALLLGDRRRDTAQRVLMMAIVLIEATARLREAQDRLAQAEAATRAGRALAVVSGVAGPDQDGPRKPAVRPVVRPVVKQPGTGRRGPKRGGRDGPSLG